LDRSIRGKEEKRKGKRKMKALIYLIRAHTHDYTHYIHTNLPPSTAVATLGHRQIARGASFGVGNNLVCKYMYDKKMKLREALWVLQRVAVRGM